MPEEPPAPPDAAPEGACATLLAVFAVEVLGTSPGNCTAVSGLVDAAPAPLFEPVVPAPADPDPVVADPVSTAPVTAPIVDPPKEAPDELLSEEVVVFDGVELQPDVAAVPFGVVSVVEQGVAAKLVPVGVVAEGAAALAPG